MSTTRLVFASRGDEAWPQVSVPGQGRRDTLVLVLPGEDVFGREAAVPGSTVRQVQAAALRVLEEELADASGSVAAVSPPPSRPGDLVCVVAREVLEQWRSAASARGLTPDLIAPDFCLIARPEQSDVLRVAYTGDRAVARASGAGFACQPDLLPMLAGGRHIERVDLEQEAASAARSGRLGRLPDFSTALAPASAPASDRKTLQRAGMAAVAAAALLMAAPWVQTLRLDLAAGEARTQARELARAALPGESRIVNPRAQLEEGGRIYGASSPELSAASALLSGLAHAPVVRINRLEAQAGEVQAQLSASQDADLAPIRERLAAAGVTVVEAPSQDADGRLTVELQLRASR